MGGVEASDTAHLNDIRKIAGLFFDAWNERNVQAMALLFSENAEVVNSLGLWWRGLGEVRQGLETMNAIGPSLTVDSISAHFVAREAAVCMVVYMLASFRRPDGSQMQEQKAISTFFIVNEAGRWSIAAAQTTAVNAEIIARLQSRKST
jgi:uncharacterized protein (TIGR02246 family)